ncbi:hypothetical protein PMIN04_007556 [Paraphaeosphaeria minitans]
MPVLSLPTCNFQPSKLPTLKPASRVTMPPIRNRAGRSRAVQWRFTPYFGSTIASISMGESSCPFTVHADLICKSSPYFRKKLQGNRKAIEGKCSICFDELDAGNQQLTFCTTCGGNFHDDCAKQWFKQSRGRLCPLCRGIWPRYQANPSIRLLSLRQTDFELYRDWLYSGQVTYNHAAEQDDFKPMVNAYLFSLYVGDIKFGTAVLQAMIDWYEDKGSYPDQDAVAIAYGTYEDGDAIARGYKVNAANNLPGLHLLQRFLVDTYVAVAHASWFEDEDWSCYPHEFLRDLVVALYYKHPAKNKWNANTWKAELEDEEKDMQGRN